MLKQVEVVFAPEGALVPAHRALERIHRVSRARLAAGLDIDAERDPPPRHGDETVGENGEIAGDEREQIAGLLERIAPDRRNGARFSPSPVASRLPLASSTGASALVGLEPHAIGREHVGPVGKIGDAAEALGLALRAIGRARAIEPHQLGVGGGIEPRLDPQREGPARRIGQRETAAASLRKRSRQAPRRRARPRRVATRRRRAPARRRRAPADAGAGRASRRPWSRGDQAKCRARPYRPGSRGRGSPRGERAVPGRCAFRRPFDCSRQGEGMRLPRLFFARQPIRSPRRVRPSR